MTQTQVPSKSELLDLLRSGGEQVLSRLRALPVDDFERGRYENGWNGRQILAHIASIEWTYPRLLDLAHQGTPPPAAQEPAHQLVLGPPADALRVAGRERLRVSGETGETEEETDEAH